MSFEGATLRGENPWHPSFHNDILAMRVTAMSQNANDKKKSEILCNSFFIVVFQKKSTQDFAPIELSVSHYIQGVITHDSK